MTHSEKIAPRLYELSAEIDFLIEAGRAIEQKNPDRCYVGACCILKDIRDGIKGVAERLDEI